MTATSNNPKHAPTIQRILDQHAFRVAMAEAGIRSLAELGRRVGLSGSYVRHIARFFIPPTHVQARIAAVLDTTVDRLWPEVRPAEVA